ncbi:MAG: hydroxymethylbilane synthase [candidate division Zixibacteria bacterium]|nr:hydroxymethylbilane synthase [candidate division Zixibacteria bacterium]
MSQNLVKIGTRGSRLALWQASHVMALLKEKNPGIKFETVIIKTSGDTDRVTALEKIGGTGLFTKKIEQELLNNTIDIAVHSAKDLPSVMTGELTIGAVPDRAPCEDVLLSRDGKKLPFISAGAIIGSGSPRRRAQLLHMRPDLKVTDIRGNVETRIKKMQEGQYNALIMARAGLERLGYSDIITEILEPDRFVPAPGQGALVVQVREDDDFCKELTGTVNRPGAHRMLAIERMLLARLQAGCSTPVGGWARVEDGQVCLTATVLDIEGTRRLYVTRKMDFKQANETLVDAVVEQLLADGAGELI